MSEEIEFVSSYDDLSTDRGFQFEFHCPHCEAKILPTAKFCPECGEKIG